MHWVYILQCYDGFLYVGETNRLYRRFGEHFSEIGGCFNTSIHVPEKLIALYQVNDISKFECLNQRLVDLENANPEDLLFRFETGMYNPKYMLNNWDTIDFDCKEASKCAENLVTLSLISHLENEDIIRGGDYCNVTFSKYQVKNIQDQKKYSKQLPLCKCKVPCDVSFNEEKKSIFFYCAKKNFYNKLYDIVEVDDSDPCNFFLRYENYDKIFDRFLKEKKSNTQEKNKMDFSNFVCYKCGMQGHTSNWPRCPAKITQTK
jgi:predicted GIY-YIG superfamily endonuclease